MVVAGKGWDNMAMAEEDGQGNQGGGIGRQPAHADRRTDRLPPVSLRHSGAHGLPNGNRRTFGNESASSVNDVNQRQGDASTDGAHHSAPGWERRVQQEPVTPVEGYVNRNGRVPSRVSSPQSADRRMTRPPQGNMGDGNGYGGYADDATRNTTNQYASQSPRYAQPAYPQQGGPMQANMGRPVGNNYHPADGSSPAPMGPPLGGYGAPPQNSGGNGGKKRGRSIIIAIVSVVVIILVAIGVWFGVSHSNDSKNTKGAESSQTSKKEDNKGDPAAGARLEKIMSTYGDEALVEPIQQSLDSNGVKATVSQKTRGTTISIIFTATDDSAMETLDDEVQYMSDSKDTQELVNELSDKLGAPVTIRYISRFKNGKESKSTESRGRLGATSKSNKGSRNKDDVDSESFDDDMDSDEEFDDPDAGNEDFSNDGVAAQPVQ